MAVEGARRNPGRAGYPAEVRERAAELRRDGLGRAAIARELGIGIATVSRWFREDGVPALTVDAEGRRDFRIAHRRTIEERWGHQQAEQDSFRQAVGQVTTRELLLIGAALYWAEGAKPKLWRRDHRLVFVNSDADVVRVLGAALDAMEVLRSAWRCQLSIHESADVEDAERYWREVVGAGPVFLRASLKHHRPTTVRLNTGEHHHGCLSVRVLRGATTYRRIAGTWEGVAEAAASGIDPPSSSG